MASSTSSVSVGLRTGVAKTPPWLWPNLLSLDAPIIAALWQDVFAHDAGVKLTLASRASLTFAVWLVYLLDRLLDTADGKPAQLTARHGFCANNRRLCSLLAASAFSLASFSVLFLPWLVIRSGLVVLTTVAAYLFVVHAFGGTMRRGLPKEAAVGLIFAIGTVLAPFARTSNPWPLLFPSLLFGILCWANTSAIEIWEGGTLGGLSAGVVKHLKLLVVSVCILSCISNRMLALGHAEIALFITSVAFWGIADVHKDLEADRLRVLIDLPLLSPLLVIGLR